LEHMYVTRFAIVSIVAELKSSLLLFAIHLISFPHCL
jgi:hypothetical protein